MGAGQSLGGKGGGTSTPRPTYQSNTRSQYSQPYQQQYMPPPQQQFSMPAPQQRQPQMSPNNLSGMMGSTNLGQQQMSRPNYQNPTSIAQLQAMYGTRGPSGGEVRSAPVYQPQPQIPPELQQLREANMRAYFSPQQYQQDPYQNYAPNQQQAVAQQRQMAQQQVPQYIGGKGAVNSLTNTPNAATTTVARPAAAQTGWNGISDIQF